MRSVILAAATAALVADSAAAQTGTPQRVLDLNAPTNRGVSGAGGNRGARGIAYLNGQLHVAAQGSVDAAGTWIATAPHTVYVFALDGTLLSEYGQDASANATAFGYRDGATDRNGSNPTVFWANENGIFARDGAGAPRNTYLAANGLRTLATNPIPGTNTSFSTLAGLAYDPNGDQGNGSWWTADRNSALIELDAAGNVLTSHPFDGTWSIHGLALDPITGRLWANSSPHAGDLVEIDPTTGLQTGRSITPGPNYASVGSPGGLDLIPDGACDRAVGGNDLVAVRQGNPDLALALILNNGDAFDYTQQDDLRVGKNGVWTGRHVVVFPGDTTLDFGITSSTGTTTFGTLFLTFGARARSNSSIIGLAPAPLIDYVECGFTLPTLQSTPAGVHIEIPVSAGTTISVPPAGLFGVREIGAQALMLTTAISDPVRLPAFPTNRVTAVVCATTAPPVGLIAEAVGSNSLNADPTAGFFRIRNPGPSPITRLRMSAVGGMVFDTDQPGIGGQLDAGNSVSGCLGTYRNNSDAVTGLDYTVAGLAPAPFCASPGASSGFKTDGSTSSSYLEFEFDNSLFLAGATFEFDADTDGGAGITGAAMAGMVLEIEFADGTWICERLAADPTNPARSSFTH